MKNIGILGSTGSIGVQALEVVNSLKDELNIKYLTANRNFLLLANQVKKFKPEYICLSDESLLPELKQQLDKYKIKILSGRKGFLEIAKKITEDVL